MRETAEETTPQLIVGLGASAGGLAALQQFFSTLSPSCHDLAFVVVQHLSPDHKSMMKALLERATSVPIKIAEQGDRLVGNTVFLTPPGCYITCQNGCLNIIPRTQHPHLPIDYFLDSLALEAGERSVAMVFSGTGCDGSKGLLSVKEVGGLVMAQDESSAEYAGMPRAAMETGAVDFVLSPAEMAMELSCYLEHRALVGYSEGQVESSKLLETLREKTQLDFSDYKKEILLRRFGRRMAVRQVSSLAKYEDLLRRDPQEVKLLTRDILIGVTRFFRDPDAFRALEQQVVIPLLESQPDRPLRLWVVGCSTGEEVYSLVILFLEQAAALGRKLQLKVFATDLDGEALRIAGLGCYGEGIVADISPARLDRFFEAREGGGYRVCAALREPVVFSQHNVAQDPPFTRIDVVSCRNLLMYFEEKLMMRVLSFFHFALQSGGFLFLGASESTGKLQNYFTDCDLKSRIYQKMGISSSLYHWPVGAGGQASTGQQLARAVEQGYRLLLEEYCPPAILVDRAGQVLHVFVNVEQYLKFPSGSVRLGLTDLLSPKLAAVASSALFRAFREEPPASHTYPETLIQHQNTLLALRARPLAGAQPNAQFCIVSFRTVATDGAASESPFVWAPSLPPDAQEQILYLRQELQQSQSNFQASVEELETSNEELQSTGQEHQTTADLLRQQLRLASEEVTTLTGQYHSSVEEMSGRIAALERFLCCAHPATVYLDDQLNILYATQGANQFLPILDSDMGRPLQHLSPNFSAPSLFVDARQVVADGSTFESTLRTQSQGEEFLMRLTPFPSTAGMRGVMITFVPALITAES